LEAGDLMDIPRVNTKVAEKRVVFRMRSLDFSGQHSLWNQKRAGSARLQPVKTMVAICTPSKRCQSMGPSKKKLDIHPTDPRFRASAEVDRIIK